jgi:mannosyl-oligosaccharide alpha-1,2-mannosidase
MGLDVRSREY